jgi:hypothetical protein
MIHSEIKFNQADAAHRAEALRCMRSMSACHGDILDIYQKLERLRDKFADHEDEFQRHMRKALKHMRALGARKPKPAADDDPA